MHSCLGVNSDMKEGEGKLIHGEVSLFQYAIGMSVWENPVRRCSQAEVAAGVGKNGARSRWVVLTTQMASRASPSAI